MSAPGVSVVVPTHRRPDGLARAVESALHQVYDGPVEVLVVFDGAEPQPPAVDPVPGRPLRTLVNDRRRGPAGARNAGVLAASHGWIAFLDDDDLWEPTKLAEQAHLLAQHPQAELLGTAMTVANGHRRVSRLLPGTLVTHDQLLQDRLAALHTSSFLARREALLGGLGLFDEHLPRSYAEDYDLLLRASARQPVLVVNRPLVTISWQGQSHFLGRWGTYADALEQLLGKHPDLAASRRGLGRIQSQIAFARAADGQRRDALRWTARAVRNDPRRARAWLAVAISGGLVSADRVARAGRRFGRGL